jgi:hypothetical protein
MVKGEQIKLWSLPPIQGPAMVTRPKERQNKRSASPRDYLSNEALDKVRKERGEK